MNGGGKEQSAPVTTEGADVERRRLALGMDKSQLAHEAGVHRDTVATIEKGGTVRDTNLAKVLRALAAAEDESGVAASPPAAESSPSLVEFEITGDFGVRVVVRGPVSNHDVLREDAARIVKAIREGDPTD